MAFVTNVYQLFALRLLLGVFGGFGAMSVALASTLAPRQKVGEAVGLIQATQLGSGIAAPFLGGVIADSQFTGGSILNTTIVNNLAGISNNGNDGVLFTNTDSTVNATLLNNVISNNFGKGIEAISKRCSRPSLLRRV